MSEFSSCDSITRVTQDSFNTFFSHLRSPGRRPAIVTSIAEGADAPQFDMEQIADELGDSFEYFILGASEAYDLTNAFGSKALSVHSGWLRLYPSGSTWQLDPGLAKSFPAPRGPKKRGTELVVKHGLDLLFREGHSKFVEPPEIVGVRTTATVTGVGNGTKAFVKIDGERSTCALDTTRICPGIAADRLLADGQQLKGEYFNSGILGTFIPDAIVNDPKEKVSIAAQEGRILLAKCNSVRKGRAILTLLPGADVPLIDDGVEDLREILHEDDLVVVEILELDGELLVSLSDDTDATALSILDGGPPWLVIADDAQEGSNTDEEIEEDETKQVIVDPINAKSEQELLEYAYRLETEKRDLERQLREVRRDSKIQARAKIPRVFRDPEKQLHYEMEQDWLLTVDETDRETRFQLKPFTFGPNFIQTLDDMVAHGGISRQKIVSVLTEVVCGRAWENHSRRVKPWSDGADGPQQRRPDGSLAWRVRLQVNTASARRLKYWEDPSGSIELDMIGTHDSGLK